MCQENERRGRERLGGGDERRKRGESLMVGELFLKLKREESKRQNLLKETQGEGKREGTTGGVSLLPERDKANHI